ncbi:MAG: acyltransferase [Betaproteobacteria bacterium RIFCSPLOWO2_12_FULL_64_23]|nr:MAG: acyltransferase [Betaproteobacteria bacterium RIFCSPLOWO2_12_FULL_64_23]
MTERTRGRTFMAEGKFKVAAVQMVSEPEVQANLAVAGELIAQAAGEGAQLVALPEYFCILGLRERDKVTVREAYGHGPIQDFLAAAAARNKVWLVGGSAPLACADPDKVRNTCLVFDDSGRRVARYDKIHLFGFDLGTERFQESRSIEPGTEVVTLDTPYARLGLSICYDLRFPELYRKMGTVDLILVPSSFTATTGKDHWEMLLRARAVENQAYVLAPAQGGHHKNGRDTWGHSMIIDPWGKVLAELARGPGVITAELDHAEIARVRLSLPALTHRVM